MQVASVSLSIGPDDSDYHSWTPGDRTVYIPQTVAGTPTTPAQANDRGSKSSAFTMLALLPVARMTNRP